MDIVEIDNATRVLGEAQGYRGLPIRDIAIGNERFMMSAWAPTQEEIEALRNGALIILSVAGTAHPPVLINVGNTAGMEVV